ncbi:MAG: hypothetical protein EBZ14_05390 [Gammaproteobacteria bacterium]|nr:hypothetical protein [Gammaproteobacteria bacterium]
MVGSSNLSGRAIYPLSFAPTEQYLESITPIGLPQLITLWSDLNQDLVRLVQHDVLADHRAKVLAV